MIVVTGTKRSGTSLWMHLLSESGVPCIGERFPSGWGDRLGVANPDGYYESELIAGIYHRTNPHPLTGAYLAPQQTRGHAVKVFIPGLVRTDVAFLDRCIATVRGWRDYVASRERVLALQPPPDPTVPVLPPVLEWWSQNFALVRDFAIRGYPGHVVSYESLVRDPARVIADVFRWLDHPSLGPDPATAAQRVAGLVRTDPPPAARNLESALPEGLRPSHLELFDALHHAIDSEQPLSGTLVRALNQAETELRSVLLEHHANLNAHAVSDLLGPRLS